MSNQLASQPAKNSQNLNSSDNYRFSLSFAKKNPVRKFLKKTLVGEYLLKQIHLDIVKDILLILLTLLTINVVVFFGFNKIKPSVDNLQVLPKITVSDDIKFMEFLAFYGVIIGLFYNAKSIHHQYHQEKLNKASEFVEKWYSQDMKSILSSPRKIKKKVYDSIFVRHICNKQENCENIELCKDATKEPPCFSNDVTIPSAYSLLTDSSIHNLIYERDPDKKDNHTKKDVEDSVEALITKIQNKTLEALVKNGDEDKKDRNNVKSVLEFFEHMAQDVNLKVVDEDYLKNFFFYIIIGYYVVLIKYINELRNKYHNDQLYCNFIKMAERWAKTGPPEDP